MNYDVYFMTFQDFRKSGFGYLQKPTHLWLSELKLSSTGKLLELSGAIICPTYGRDRMVTCFPNDVDYDIKPIRKISEYYGTISNSDVKTTHCEFMVMSHFGPALKIKKTATLNTLLVLYPPINVVGKLIEEIEKKLTKTNGFYMPFWNAITYSRDRSIEENILHILSILGVG